MAKLTSVKSKKFARNAAVERGAAMSIALADANPPMPKADGDAAMPAHIAAMPGRKSGIGRRIDALVVRTISGGER